MTASVMWPAVSANSSDIATHFVASTAGARLVSLTGVCQQPYIQPRPITYDLVQAMPADVIKVHVTKVYDGDSFRARGTDGVIRKYRMLGIDAPETGHNAYVSDRQPFSIESRDALRERILNRDVYIDIRPYRRVTKSWDRTLVDVYDMADSSLINGWMVENGYAWNIPVAGRVQPAITDAMRQAGTAAQAMKIGLFNKPATMPKTWRKSHPGQWIKKA